MRNRQLGSPFEKILQSTTDSFEEMHAMISRLSKADLTVADWQVFSAKVGVLIADFDKASAQLHKKLGVSGGQDRILYYLRSRVGQIVKMEEIRGVAAIHEWARRIRELRVEHGWPISTSTQRPDLKRGEYLLESLDPDERLAADWRLAKEMRNLKGANGRAVSGKARGLEYLKRLSPRAADKDQLQAVMKIPSYARRLRELSEAGWAVVSNVDDPTLAPGTYRLETLEKRPPRVRQAIKLRHEVFERDNFKCQDDGRSPNRDGVTLQVHHILFVSEDGGNSLINLVTLCSDCHAGRHAVAKGKSRDELLEPGWPL